MEQHSEPGHPTRTADRHLQLEFVPEAEPASKSISGKIITIFGSSKPAPGSAEYEEAELIGRKLAGSGLSVCTGGYKGIMEGVSKGASEGDVKIIGVTSVVFFPTPNQYVNIQVHTESLYERLQRLVELGDGYIVLKGGTGTLVEFSLIWELMNKNIISEKPIVVVGNFWKPVIDLLDKELAFEGLESCTKFVRVAKDGAEAVGMMVKALGNVR